MAAAPTGQRPTIAAEAFLRALADHGIDYFFANPGTDFPPIVEAFSRAKKTNAKVPRPVLVPHENLAVAMAHGAYLMNGRPQAVMVHVNVGTANTINNLTNLSRDRVPLILAAGRTPITEKGSFGSRTRPIHWAQEMFDQAGMVRELVKWDYELRVPAQVGDVVSRAVEVAMASPRGPVYLVLPREPLSAPVPEPIGPAEAAAASGGSAPRSTFGGAACRLDRGRRAATDHCLHFARQCARGAGRSSPSARQSRSSSVTRARCVCRQPTRCISASSPARCWPTPTLSSSSTPMRPGSRACRIRPRDATSPTLARSRSSCATRCAVPERSGDPGRHGQYADRAHRRDGIASADGGGAHRCPSRTPDRAHAHTARAACEGFRLRANDLAGISVAVHRRSRRPRRGDLQRIFAARRAYPARQARHAVSLSVRPAGSAGALARRSAPSSPLRKNSSSRRSVTARTCSPIRRLDIGCRPIHNLPILTILFNNSRYGAVRSATMSMFKDGVAGEDDGRMLADLDPSPPSTRWRVRKAPMPSEWKNPPTCPTRWQRARDAVVNEKRQALLNVITPY